MPFENFIEELKNRPQEHRMAVVVLVTLGAAVILVPIWIWHTRNINPLMRVAGQQIVSEEEEQDIMQNEQRPGTPSLRDLNPIKMFDQQLTERFANPTQITDVRTRDEHLHVHFRVENNTMADLIFPASNAYLMDSRETIISSERAANIRGDQFVPLVSPGQTREGILYFPKVFNGRYELFFTGLRYDDEGQSEFMQTIHFDVTDAALPRT